MAGVKVTDLTTLGAADATDVMYIVDTSANQSKQIEVQDIYSGMPQFDSGAFNPTVTNETPNTTIINMNGGQYSRVGNVVTMNCWFEVQFGVSDNSVAFNIDLPISSAFTQTKQLMGILTSNDLTNFQGGTLNADIVNNLGLIVVNGVTGSTITYVYAMFQYEII